MKLSERIKNRISNDVTGFYTRLFGCSPVREGKDLIFKPSASWWPYRTDSGDISGIKVDAVTGLWNTHSAGERGGSGIDAIMLVYGYSKSQAIGYLAEQFGEKTTSVPCLPPPPPPPVAIGPKNPFKIIEPVPADAPDIPPYLKLGKPDKLFPFLDANGLLLHYRARWHATTDRKKVLRPLVLFSDGWKYGTCDMMTNGRIYGLDRLAKHPDWPALIVEGEACCDAAVLQFANIPIVPITKGIMTTDWTPLKGRRIYLLPDADKAGRTQANKLAEKLHGIGCHVVMCKQPNGFNDNGDWNTSVDPQSVLDSAVEYPFDMQEQNHHSADLIFSDVWNGDVLTANAADTLAYVEGSWRVCDGGIWHKQPEKALNVACNVGRYIRENYAAYEDHNKAAYKSLGNVKTLERMLTTARGALLADANEFDQHPMFLPLKDKILDLDSGQVIDHDAKYKISTVAPVIYTPGAQAPLFESAISRLAMGSAEIESFYMRMFGYACTGRMTEQKMFVLVGPGHNGKTTPLIAIAHALGNLSWTAKPFMFARKHAARAHDQSGPTHSLANLRGKRFIYCGEVDESFEWIPTLINCFTGGEEITADPKNRDEIRYSPVGKIFYVCNDVPIMPTTNDGAWRRLLYIPTCGAISADERDDFYQEKIKTESAGILRLLQDGVDDWKNGGLRVPDSIEAFTLKKRGGSDAVSMFIGEECAKFPGYTWRTADAYEMYKSYCDRNSRSAVKIGAFTKQVNAMGYRKDGRVQGLTYFQGVKPKLVPMESIEA